MLKSKFNSFKTGGWRCYNPQGFSIATFERSILFLNHLGTFFVSSFPPMVVKKIHTTLNGGRLVVQKWVYSGICATNAILKSHIFFLLISNLFFYVQLFIFRNFCHKPGKNRMFLKFLWLKTNFIIFSFFWLIWRHSDIKRKWMVSILADIDRRDQDL